jgi:arylsulfatase A-like enzyme
VALRGNVLFITVDQWRGDCLGVAGHPVVQTPALDRLAGRGVRFANHWANTAPCGPSRATIYTGLYAMNHRSVLNGTPLSSRHTNVALEARRAGYDPVLFGYTDTSADPDGLPPGDPLLTTYEGVLPGFRAVLDFPFESLTPWISWLAEQGYDVDPDDPQAVYRGVRWGGPARYAAEHSETAFLTDHALAWLDEQHRSSDDGWFVHLSYLRPHPPYQVPAPYHALFDPAEMPTPRRAQSRDVEGAQHLVAQLAVDVLGAPDDRSMGKILATYYAMMREVDDQLARVLAWLDETGEADRTLVVVTSDHGDQMGDHWLLDKLGYWDESYHVPLIVRDPFADAPTGGRVVDAFTEHVDLLPTILGWIGPEIPPAVDGRALQPFFGADGEAPADWRTEVHWEWDFRDPVGHVFEDLLGVPMDHCTLNVIRDHHTKYVHFAADALPDLLFDLDADPHQFRDLASDPLYAGRRGDMAAKLLSWRMRHADRSLAGTVLTPDGPVVRHEPRV